MKKELINNTHFQRLIALKSNKLDYEDVTDEDIDNIEELSIHGKLINGLTSGIDLKSCIGFFTNLSSLSISDFILVPEVLEELKKLEKLRKLEVIGCEFDGVNFDELFERMQIRFVGCRELPFEIRNQRVIDIQGCEVDFRKIDLTESEAIQMLSCKIKNARNLDEEHLTYANLNGSILTNEEGEVIPDITVPEGCRYSHLEDITQVMDSPIELE